jgi:hypothetical protein
MSNPSTYIGVFLDRNSQGLLNKLRTFVPKDWVWFGDHLTIEFFGKKLYPEDFPPPYNEMADENKTVSLVVTHIGVSDKAIAVKVAGVPLVDKIPHITLATPNGENPKASKLITNWKKIRNFTLHGVICGNGDAEEALKEKILMESEKLKNLYDQIKKTKSFTTPEGRFSVYDIEKVPIGRGDMFTVWEHPDGWIIRNALVPDDLQQQNIATIFYQRMNAASIKATGKPLRSTQPRTLNSGEIVHELSPLAIKLWDRLTRWGEAEKIANKNYRFRLKETDETSDTLVPHSNRWNDQMDGGDYDMEVWAAPTQHVKYGGNMTESVMRENLDVLRSKHIGWVTPDNQFIGSDSHIDYLWDNYGAEIDALKQSGADVSKHLYELAYQQGLIRVYFETTEVDTLSVGIEGRNKNHIIDLLEKYYYPAVKDRQAIVAIDVLSPKEHYLFQLPRDKNAFAHFVFGGALTESIVKKLVKEITANDVKSVVGDLHNVWVTPDGKLVQVDHHKGYAQKLYPNIKEERQLYNQAYKDGYVRVVYGKFFTGSQHRVSMSIEGINKANLKATVEAYLPTLMSKPSTVWIENPNEDYHSFELPEQRYQLQDFLETGRYNRNMREATTKSIVKKLVKEITTTFPFNVGGADATYDSWTDSDGDRNKEQWDTTRVELREAEYSGIHGLPFIDAIEKAGGMVYQVGNDNEIILKNINISSLIRAISPFGTSKLKKNNNLIVYHSNAYPKPIYLWLS